MPSLIILTEAAMKAHREYQKQPSEELILLCALEAYKVLAPVRDVVEQYKALYLESEDYFNRISLKNKAIKCKVCQLSIDTDTVYLAKEGIFYTCSSKTCDGSTRIFLSVEYKKKLSDFKKTNKGRGSEACLEL